MALLVVTSLVERGGLRGADVFDLDHGDPDARPGDDEVGVSVLPAVAEAGVAGDRRIVGQLLAQRLHERLVGRVRELRSVRKQLSRHVCVPWRAGPTQHAAPPTTPTRPTLREMAASTWRTLPQPWDPPRCASSQELHSSHDPLVALAWRDRGVSAHGRGRRPAVGRAVRAPHAPVGAGKDSPTPAVSI